MKLVIDASVAVKWILPEPGSDDAAALRTADADLIAPSLVVAEIGNAIWKAARRGDIGRSDAAKALRTAVAHFSAIMPFDDLAETAIEMAIDLRHPIYDCLYLALARRENAPLATADEAMVAAARKAKVKVRRVS
jgi:predicted nucleic acid-binding protein